MIRFILLSAAALLATQTQDSKVASDQKTLESQITSKIDQAGWHYQEREFADSKREFNSALILYHRLIRHKQLSVTANLKTQYLRLNKANDLLVERGFTSRTIKPIPGAVVETGQTTKPSVNPFAQNQNTSSAAGTGDATPPASTNPFLQGAKPGTGQSSANPFLTKPNTGNTDSAGSSSGTETPTTTNPFLQGEKPGTGQGTGQTTNPFLTKPDSGDTSADTKKPPSANPFLQGSGGATGSPTPTNLVSFTKDIVPILVQRCGNCHVRGQRGEFSAASYDQLIKGGPSGDTIVADKPDDSVLIQMVEDGDMPPQGELPAAEIKKLRDWITQGAKFDGLDSAASISGR